MEHIQYRNDLKAKAKKLRNNMTKEERHLWYDFLKEYGVHFYRQKPIGNYIVDFYCARVRLVIERDGSEHYEDEEGGCYKHENGVYVPMTEQEIQELYLEKLSCLSMDMFIPVMVPIRIIFVQ